MEWPSISNIRFLAMPLIIDINSTPMSEPDYLAIIKARGQGALDIKMGIEMLEVSPERLVARMPVEGNTQPIGLLHGGANVVLAESLGSIGTQLHAGREDVLTRQQRKFPQRAHPLHKHQVDYMPS